MISQPENSCVHPVARSSSGEVGRLYRCTQARARQLETQTKRRVCSNSNREPYALKCQECREFNNVIMINLVERMKSTTHDDCNKQNEIPQIFPLK